MFRRRCSLQDLRPDGNAGVAQEEEEKEDEEEWAGVKEKEPHRIPESDGTWGSEFTGGRQLGWSYRNRDMTKELNSLSAQLKTK